MYSLCKVLWAAEETESLAGSTMAAEEADPIGSLTLNLRADPELFEGSVNSWPREKVIVMQSLSLNASPAPACASLSTPASQLPLGCPADHASLVEVTKIKREVSGGCEDPGQGHENWWSKQPC